LKVPILRLDSLEVLVNGLFDTLQFGHHLRVIGGDTRELHPRLLRIRKFNGRVHKSTFPFFYDSTSISKKLPFAPPRTSRIPLLISRGYDNFSRTPCFNLQPHLLDLCAPQPFASG
jgi:hypothetical protein